MKRHQRAGLPIYPQDFQAKTAAVRFHHQEGRRTQPNSTSLSSSPYNLCFPPLDPINSFATPLNPLQNHLSPLAFYSNPSHQLKLFANTNSNDGCLPLSLPPVSSYQQSPLSTNLFSQNPTRQAAPINTPPSVLFYNDADMESNMSFTSLIMGGQVQPIGFIPSGQTPPGPTTSWGGGACFEEASNKSNNNGYSNSETSQQGMAGNMNNSGLLDALLQEAKTISFKGKSNSDDLLPASNEGKRAMDSTVKEEGEKLWDDLSSSQSSNICKFLFLFLIFHY
jgi:myb proto-oncogene protein